MKHISERSIVCRNSAVAFSQLDDELLAIDAQAGYCYAINETAGRIWEILSESHSIVDLCTQLMQEYAVDEETCLKEVIPLVQKLHDSGLVQIKDEQTNA